MVRTRDRAPSNHERHRHQGDPIHINDSQQAMLSRRVSIARAARAALLISAACGVATPAVALVRHVRAGDNLQAVLNAAQPGDELRLQAGTTFLGNFTLPVTAGTDFVTIRTDLPDASLPGDLQRVTPAAAAQFARIQSPNSASALRTAPGAHHWRLLFLQFAANRDGYGDIIQLGDGSAAQSQLSQVPYSFVIDRVYVHGDPLVGQKRGIALNASDVTIRNSYVNDIKAVGIDTQAIAGWNGPGPYLIENNYLEAAGENFLLGGADPAIPNLVTTDVIFRSNHVTRPLAWMDPIVPTPADVTATAAVGGTLPAGTYAYRIVARRGMGQGTIGHSLPSAEVTTTVKDEGAAAISWAAVQDATEYQVYGRTAGGENLVWTVAGPPFIDTGGAGPTGAAPTDGTVWQVKNLFELKNARRVQVTGNVFENNWKAAQPGYAVLFTPRNSGGACPWCVVELVTFEKNIVRNVTSGFNILGYDSPHASQQTNGIVIRGNLVYGVSQRLRGNGWVVLAGDQPRDITIDHNTFDFDGTTLLYAYGGTAAAPRQITGLRYTGNVSPHNAYGINGAGASTGTLALKMYFPGAVVTGNLLSGGPASKYPSGNRFDGPFGACVANRGEADYRPAGALGTPRGSDEPMGADVAALASILASVTTGRIE
jgi:hypothetical protein